MGRDACLAQVDDKAHGIEAAVSTQRQPPGRTRGVAVDHVERRAPFGSAIGPGKIALHDEARPVLPQSMTDEAQHRPGAGGFPVEPRVRIGVEPWVAFVRRCP